MITGAHKKKETDQMTKVLFLCVVCCKTVGLHVLIVLLFEAGLWPLLFFFDEPEACVCLHGWGTYSQNGD
jgi:hypothetical protein